MNVIIESIAEGQYDDLIAKVPDSYKSRVENIAELVFNYLTNTEKLIKLKYNKSPKDDKKTFMIWVSNNVPKNIQPYVRLKYLGEEYNLLKKQHNSYKKMINLGYSDENVIKATVGG